MKRDEALRSLSRDHHQALVVAQNLRRETDPAVGAERFLDFWRTDGSDHFRVEEEVLLPAWAENASVDEPAVAKMLLDHLWLRTAARRLQRRQPSLEELEEIGGRLAAHVRLEEREIFPAIERALEDSQLTQLAVAIAAAERES